MPNNPICGGGVTDLFIVMSGKILIMALTLKAPYPGNATPLLNNSSVLSSNYIREGSMPTAVTGAYPTDPTAALQLVGCRILSLLASQ